MTPENDWNLLREDGGRGGVVKMWNASGNEMVRLSMFYLAAWKIGGDESFKADYLATRDEAMTESEKTDLSEPGRFFAYNQMQLSLEFVRDYDDDPAFKARCDKLMRTLAVFGLEGGIRLADENTTEENKAVYNTFKAIPWNKMAAWPWFGGMLDGRVYYCPINTKSVVPTAPQAAWMVRDIADALLIYVRSPEASDNKAAMDAIEKIISAVDLTSHTTDAPIYLLEAYYSLKKLLH